MQHNGGSRSGLCKSTLQRRLEPWRWGAQWPPIRSWQWQIEWIIIADPLRTTWEVAQELYIDHSTVNEHLKQTGKVKTFNKWVPYELITNKKKCCFVVSGSHSMQQQWTISWLDCDVQWKVDFIWQLAQWLDLEAPKWSCSVISNSLWPHGL